MQFIVHEDGAALAAAAAAEGAVAIEAAIAKKGAAVVVLATGASQFAMLAELVGTDIDWGKVTVFHLDEYVGLGTDHPASFRGYLNERFVARVPALREFLAVEGDAPDIDAEIARLNARLAPLEVDVCFAGIGENCHLAFNDPPANFEVDDPYIVVELDEACRRQQLGEGWFPDLESVPKTAVSMSVRQIMKAKKIVLSVPDERKANAVRHAVEGEIGNLYPASVLQNHPAATLHLDPPAASLLAGRKG
ncbi:glucosamine-6-phosphate deaminase [Acuticoccus sp. MNP-M23]|uniref:glucosamine-6-phosphate deaminase n=1 Tax=Acuticoccus sp. MNP-M23 TaxID=3072793 RepID=UPI002814EB07|nr:glucosamine-6-phosphate deaminase [Acuticoccus sp. MNP-M23]WMS42646.1 glucosamine-6-phosphate deaminase [Acuticoccus sp. MNP-M23]